MNKLDLVFGVIRTVRNWPTYFADYSGFFGRDGYVVYSLPGAKIKCRRKTGDRSTINEIWIRELYLPNKDFQIRENDIVVDIGGHIGVFSVYAGTKAKDGEVYAYEPQKDNFEMLRENISLNSLGNVKPFNMAVAGKAGKANLNIAHLHTGGHSLVMKSSDTYSEVECTTLQKIMGENGLQKIDFLKMDCEGAEYDIFFNTPKALLRRIERIGMEIHNGINGHNHPEIVSLLHKNGFNVHVEGNMLYAIKK